jgi:hypothetical protein
MNRWAALFCLLGGSAGILNREVAKPPVKVVVAGNSLGYLSPCGCTDPMSGGILREGAALRAMRAAGPVLVLFTGNMIERDSRQDVLKAEAMAQALNSWGVAACNVGRLDAKLDMGELMTVSRLTGNRLTTASLASSPTNPLPKGIEQEGYYIFGASTSPEAIARDLEETPEPLDASIEEGLREASTRGEPPILLLDGDRDSAARIAREHPQFAMIAYNSTGRPPLKVEEIGTTCLVTAGEHNQYVVTLPLGQPSHYAAQLLTPDYSDDAETDRFYKGYLKEVDREDLWAKTARVSGGPQFAGSRACASCHQESYAVWLRSGHAHALKTLIAKGHGRDPECLPCHVVGAAYQAGFQSFSSTPDLAAVGCESCHGAGLQHARQPRVFRLAKVTPQACISCHNSLNSPAFDYPAYWKRIRHSR